MAVGSTVASALEWTFLLLAQTLLVVISLACVLYLLFLLPQQVPSQSPSIRVSIALRVCRLESIALVAVLGVTSFVWNALFGYLVSQEFLVSNLGTVLTQASLLTTYVAFAPHHLLAHRPIVSDPVVSLLASFPFVLVRTAQSAALSAVAILFSSTDLPFSALLTLVASSTSLFFVYFTTAKAFSCLFLRTAYSWEGAPGCAPTWLELQHPAVTCTECTKHAPSPSIAPRLTPSELSSLRSRPSANYIAFLQARTSSHPGTTIQPHLVLPSTRSFEFWNFQFQALDLHLAAASGNSSAFFASETVWLQVFSVTTATIDGFAYTWRALSAWKVQPTNAGPSSLLHAMWQILTSDQPSPSTFLQQITASPMLHAFVATGGLHAAAAAVPSPWMWPQKLLANSLWHITLATVLLLSKVTLPAILYSLASCRVACEALRVPQSEEYEAIVYALDSALQKITGVFRHVLPELTHELPVALAAKVTSYAK
ncbi:hypothetical protein DYB25_002723 [Aphanomyces astaci]|uniref:Uncharacterized protein n=1 Tax=Aphanomyces astaci TaxID=112090 RepID=A0A397E2Y7_APHAT|nr:hypothetical protein DYB25_002723 [Aphanomyces astaci]RHY54723.1 hypothetical protein DYB34_006051 [Aphanomyces astaci]RHY75563.1 hypothetical protein DYB30_008158 [Aphanomyces astaci]RHZ21988.1 hypothetical protein DYB31_005493 [Aphanomyces astaci]